MNDFAGKTILLVEDEALIAMAEKLHLERYGYKVKTANSGEKAVELAATSQDIDLILMDIDLGSGMDGTEAAEIILREHELPVLFVSSHTEPEIVEKTERITSYGYVVKNSSFTVLDASIKMAFKLFYASRRIDEERRKNQEANEELRATNENLLTTQAHLLEIERDLLQSEEKYRYIDESSLDCIYSYDADGRFTHANKALCALLGLPAESKRCHHPILRDLKAGIA